MLRITDIEYAREKDKRDGLSTFRDAFVESEPGLLYLDGNSLGKLPVESLPLAHELIETQWGKRLIRGWNEGWLELPLKIGEKIALLIGAHPGEVIMADSTSVNLYKLILAALRIQTGRNKIITDNLNFPSDLYILQGITQSLNAGHTLQIIHSDDDIHGPEHDIMAQLDEQTALLTLSHTVFKSGYVYDMEKITQAAHQVGALVIWDLSHSVGSVQVELARAQADMAVGCTYKYLNGGPGSPAFLYVREALQDQLQNPISGWMGQKNMFDFSLAYVPNKGITRFLTGTPSVLSTALVEPGIDLLLKAGMDNLIEKSRQQTTYFEQLWEARLAPLGFGFQSPRDPTRRGSHISLSHPDALAIDLALIQEYGVIPDFRAPDNLRFGIAPLYTSFQDVYATVARMVELVESGAHERFKQQKPKVT